LKNIKLNKLSKRFGNELVIKSINLEVSYGEFLVIVGPSGCGKSTLLRMLAGLESVTEGNIEIDGKDVKSMPPLERGVAMVFQNYALYPHMNVEENIGFGLKIAKVPKSVRRQKVLEVAKILKLESLLSRKPKTLSGGQRQRVAIGRAIIKKPRIFLFDEPLSNLDAELRVQMRLEIARLHKELSATMIYVTHDQVEAMTLADRIVVLRDGIIEQFGPPIELYQDPKNIFVAGFIGSPKMNFIPCLITKISQGYAEINLKEPTPDPLRVKIKKNTNRKNIISMSECTLGFRPENIIINPNGQINCKVTAVERLGNVSYIYSEGARGNTITIEQPKLTKIKTNEMVTFSPDPEYLYLFDKSGKRL